MGYHGRRQGGCGPPSRWRFAHSSIVCFFLGPFSWLFLFRFGLKTLCHELLGKRFIATGIQPWCVSGLRSLWFARLAQVLCDSKVEGSHDRKGG
jgi:hypothetical protein